MTYTRSIKITDRNLILIDIAEMTASQSPTAKDVEVTKRVLGRAIRGLYEAQIILACSHHAVPAVAFSFPRARHRWRSGRDGARLALLEILENERVDERFNRITICSGHEMFAAEAARLASKGLEVHVVAIAGRLSPALELAASRVTLLVPVESGLSSAGAS